MRFSKKEKYEMNMEHASEALQNVLAACDAAPSSVALDKVSFHTSTNTRIYRILILITSLILSVHIASPFLIVPAAKLLETYLKPEPVVLVDDYVEDNFLYIKLSGDNILYKKAYMEKPDGTILQAITYSREDSTICFPFISDVETNIYIPVEGAAPLHLLLTPQ